jgi:SAM-dependent methyltransferase
MYPTIAVMTENTSLTEKSYWDRKWVAQEDPRQLDVGEYLNGRIARALATYLPRTPSLVLEVGAGNSLWLPYLARAYGHAVAGVDYSRVGCDRLAANLRASGDNVIVIQGDIFQHCFAPESFEVVYSNGFIEHFTNYPDLLALFRSWLKPGGLLITLVPNKKYVFRHVERWIAPDEYDAHVPIEPGDLEKSYRRAGLEDVAAAYLGSFSTWKYNSKAGGLTRWLLRLSSKAICLPVHAALKATGFTPESRPFSPLVFAVGRAPEKSSS